MIVLLVMLDVKNAFILAKWSDMLEALEKVFQIPEYLFHMVRDYLWKWLLLYEMKKGKYQLEQHRGQFWGLIFGMFPMTAYCTAVPEGVFLVIFADDLVAVISAHDIKIAQMKLSQVMKCVNRCIKKHGFKLVGTKNRYCYPHQKVSTH